jgi:hypothetical protein
MIPIRLNRKKIKKTYLNELESQIKSLNKEIIDLKNLITIYKRDNESQVAHLVEHFFCFLPSSSSLSSSSSSSSSS